MPLAAGALVSASLYTATTRAKAADDVSGDAESVLPQHAECAFFGPQRDHFMAAVLKKARLAESATSAQTRQVTAMLPTPQFMPGGSHGHDGAVSTTGDTIDAYVFADLQSKGITPAESTSDFEFMRRVSLDLTGRIPTPTDLLAFVNDSNPNKRAALIDNLLASPQWVDKWTVFYSDLFKNTSSNSQININNEGRNAFYKYIHDSLLANKPYNQLATEMIAAQGTSNIQQGVSGQMNYLLLNWQGGGPTQDIYDAQAAGIADEFLGLAHMNCLLCHNGLGHLDSLSLWAGQMTRYKAWQFSSFISHSSYPGTASPINPANPTAGRLTTWAFTSNNTDYALNTTTGNRPARQPLPGGVKNVSPIYIDGTSAPGKSEDYRTALARFVTSDKQFARAAVNYIWAHL
ncbi:MAG TPA: DUF1549 domain-containing protein, partial [Bryobacteraceae bacterium]